MSNRGSSFGGSPTITHSALCDRVAFACAAENARDALRDEIGYRNRYDVGPLTWWEREMLTPTLRELRQTATGYQDDGMICCDEYGCAGLPVKDRYWTFAEDEGGTTTIVANDGELTLQRYSGPDCDGTTSESHYRYVQRDVERYPHDHTYANDQGQRRGDWVEVHCDDPTRAYYDDLFSDLGGALFSRYCTSQPEDH